MSNKTVKWTKKFKAVIISLGLAFAVALGGACAAIGLSLNDNNQRLGGDLGATDAVAVDANELFPQLRATTVTNNAITLSGTTQEMATGWAAAITKSKSTSPATKVTVTLGENWTASDVLTSGSVTNTTFTGTSTAATSTGFDNGAILVPANASIVLDLNGRTINRNLSAKVPAGVAYGYVMKVMGTLELKDGKGQDEGQITGGANTSGNSDGGGGILVKGSASKLTMSSGAVVSNHAIGCAGGGVHVRESATFNMTGGVIFNNRADNSYGGGAIYLMGGSNVNITSANAQILGNSATVAGGISAVSDSTLPKVTALKITNGTFKNNKADTSGGAIRGYAATNYNGSFGTTIEISGGTFTGNSVISGNGGAIALTATNKTMLKTTISGGTFTDNSCTESGGAITENNSTLTISNGTFTENTGFYVGGIRLGSSATSDVIISGGTINNNTGTLINDVRITSGTTAAAIAQDWANAVALSTSKNVAGQVGLYLVANWNAADITTDGAVTSTSFAPIVSGAAQNNVSTTITGSTLSVQAFSSGRIYVPNTANMVLSLGVQTINRKLTAATSTDKADHKIANGQVIFTQGKLKINGGNIDTADRNTTGTITGGCCAGAYMGGGVYVQEATGNLTLESGMIKNNVSDDGGGVSVRINGKFTMNGGCIEGNTVNGTRGGGGVYMYDGAVFTMNGGIIRNNKLTGTASTQGGGGIVMNGETTTVNMNGGEISGNSSSKSGGGIWSSGTINMSGGKITANTATNNGGGVYTANFNMSGGQITNNTAGANGGAFYVTTKITLSGVSVVTGNVVGGTISNGVLTGGTASNLMLADGKKVTIGTGGFKTGASIGVAISGTPTYPYTFTESFTSNFSAGTYFYSDNKSYTVVQSGSGTAWTGVLQSAASKVYVPKPLAVTGLIYNGAKQNIIVGYDTTYMTGTIVTPSGGKTATLSGSNYQGQNAGKYQVNFTLKNTAHYWAGNSTAGGTVSVTVDIAKAQVEVTFTDTEFKYDGAEHKPTASKITAVTSVTGSLPALTAISATGVTNAVGGQSTITLTDSTGNFALKTNKVTMTGEKAVLSLTWGTTQFTYDGATHAPVLAGVASQGIAADKLPAINTTNFTYTAGKSAAGTYDITVTLANATYKNNFTLSPYDQTTYTKTTQFTINKATLTINTFTYATVTYGTVSAAPTLTVKSGTTTVAAAGYTATYSVSKSSNSTADTSYPGKATVDTAGKITPNQAGKVQIKVELAETANYYAVSATYDVTIAKAALTAASTATKVYDGTTTANVTVGTVTGIKNNDNITITASATYADANVGTNKSLTISYTLSGDKALNYSMANKTITNASITAKNLSSATVTLSGNTGLIYNGSAQKAGATVKIVLVTGNEAVTLSSTDDYTLSYANGTDTTATNAGTVTVTATGKNNYTGTKTATYSIAKATIQDDNIEFKLPANIYVGQAYSAVLFTGSTAKINLTGAADGLADVAGTFAWENPTDVVTNTAEAPDTVSKTAKAIFTPTNTNIAAYEKNLTFTATQLKVTANEYRGSELLQTQKIPVDYGKSFGYKIVGADAVAEQKTAFSYTKNGSAVTDQNYFTKPNGYSVAVGTSYDSSAGTVSGSDAVNKASVTANFTVYVVYTANTDTAYKIYYILQQATPNSLTDNNGYLTTRDTEELSSSPSVKVYNGTGVTNTTFAYVDSATQQAFADWSEKQHYAFNSLIGTPTILGNGNGYVIVLMKLREYTVTYSATGATPATQTKTFKYGALMTAPTRKPSLSLSTFAGWFFDRECTQAVNFDLTSDTRLKVAGNTTLYALFNADEYTLEFDLNIGFFGDAYVLPNSSELIIPSDTANLVNEVTWDYESLFPTDDGFGTGDWSADGDGVYAIKYTVKNVPTSITLRNVMPSAIGYVFKGWFKDAEFDKAATTAVKKPTTGTDKKIRLFAKWEPASYTLHYETNGGSFINSETIKNNCLLSEIRGLQEGATTRGGYTFDDWYVKSDKSLSLIDALPDGYTDRFILAQLASVYNYDFSNITLYAGWTDIDITLEESGVTNGQLSYKRGAAPISVGDSIHIGETITVEAQAANGYEFSHLIIKGVAQPAGVKQFTVSGSNVVIADGSGSITVSAVFVEKSYTIKYEREGGTIVRTPGLTFTKSMVEAGSVELASNVYKRGWDFRGWVFDGDESKPAFDTSRIPAGTTDYRNAELIMIAPTDLDGVHYDNVTLTAVWKEQSAEVHLYEASYTGGYQGDATNGYVIPNLKTDQKINITNPVMASFDFVGWATSKNGAVVYPASEDESVTTIEYKVNADKDENGKKLNNNNLYAVWHIKGVDRIVMSVENNGSTYGNGGVTMKAKPAQTYEMEGVSDIDLTYNWYRILDGMYDECFLVGSVWVRILDEAGNTKVVAYEYEGKYYQDADCTTLISAPTGEGLASFEYKRFNNASVGKACVLATGGSQKHNNPGADDSASITIQHVGNCGRYVCVVEVSGSREGALATKAGGFGEIEISMEKALYENVTLNDLNRQYNAQSPTLEQVGLKFINNDAKGATLTLVDDVWYLNMPDNQLGEDRTEIDGTGSRFIVTYKYYRIDAGNKRVAISGLDAIKAAGTYVVRVEFTWATGNYDKDGKYIGGGDSGNYEEMDPIEAEIVITPYEIKNIGYVFKHGTDEVELATGAAFEGTYDGTAYSVEASVVDKFGEDDVQLKLTVNTINANNVEEAYSAATVNAGRYSVVINRSNGLDGEDKGNYVLGNGLTLRKEYVINKATFEAKDNIAFEDAEVEYDGEKHVVEYELLNGKTIPEDLIEVKYTYEYVPENAGYDGDALTGVGNGGVNAGVYNVTLKFAFRNDTAGKAAAINYEALEEMTATLTVTQSKFFYATEENGEIVSRQNVADLLREADFVGKTYTAVQAGSHELSAGKYGYLPVIESGVFTTAADFEIEYAYYRVNTSTNERTALTANQTIVDAGRYEIVATITYLSALYANNFEEIFENESTITYVIEAAEVTAVRVSFKSEFENGGSEVKLGEVFDYTNISRIEIDFKDNSGATLTRTVSQQEDFALADIKYDANGVHANFWKVGESYIAIGVYGKYDASHTVNVKQEISEFTVQYLKNGSWVDIDPEDGVEYGENYEFRVRYSGINDQGNHQEAGLSSSVTKSGAEWTLGKNVLVVSDSESNYVITEEISVKMYKVVQSNEVTWKYYERKTAQWLPLNEEGALPYIGEAYSIRATIEGKNFDVETKDGSEIKDCLVEGNYEIKTDRLGDYKLDGVILAVHIVPRDLTESLTWSDNGAGYTYNGSIQIPEITGANLADVDEGAIEFVYSYYPYDAESETLGDPVNASDVSNAGTYAIKASVSSINYAIDAEYVYVFTIGKATVAMSATYNEHNYGPNVTYAGNAHGLRLDAVSANFTGAEVDGHFVFYKGKDADGNPIEIAGNDASILTLLKNAGTGVYVDYAYIPEEPEGEHNYDVKYGKLELTVKAQVYRSGTNGLFIELGANAKKRYILGQSFDTTGVKVYRVYESYYEENGTWYGFRGDAITSGLSLKIGSANANGHAIVESDVVDGKLTLVATAAASQGTLAIPVIATEVTGLSIVTDLSNKIFYVGQKFDFSEMEFKATYKDEIEDADELLKVPTIESDYDNVTFTADNIGNITVTFTYFDATCTTQIEVRAKETLTVIAFTETERILLYNDGNAISIPMPKFSLGGETYGADKYAELGISVTYKITKNGSEISNITAIGADYRITYTIKVNNPRFNDVKAYSATFEVTDAPYVVTISDVPTGLLSAVYTGATGADAISIPKPDSIEVTDRKNPNAEVTADVRYFINDVRVTTEWNRVNVGTYTVRVEVWVENLKRGEKTYVFNITQATNEGALTVKTVVLGAGANFKFPVTATFGTKTAADLSKVTYKYSQTNNPNDESVWTTEVPATSGTWYVKVTVPGTTNYTEIVLIEEFEVRDGEISAATGDGYVEGAITGESGIGKDWKLEITQMASEEVSQVSISKQNVMDGYEVVLKDEHDLAVKGEGKYTIRIKLSDELSGRGDLNVYYKSADGKTTKLDASVKDGYVEFRTSEFGTFMITNAQPKESVGLLVSVIVLGVAAAGMIAACVVVFLIKRKRGTK